MYHLHQLAEHSYYIDTPAKVGLYVNDNNQAWLFDSGHDAASGQAIYEIISQQGWQLQAVILSHSNADHMGGGARINALCGCPVYISHAEQGFAEFTEFQSGYLFGAYPAAQLRVPLLCAEPFPAQDLSADVLPPELQIIPLPGHFIGHVGLRTPDDVYFLADAIADEQTLIRGRFFYIYDFDAQLQTYELMSSLQGKICLPAHAEPTRDIAALAAFNRQIMLENMEIIYDMCAKPISSEQLIKQIFDRFSLRMDEFSFLVSSSNIRAYLSYLRDHDRISLCFSNNLPIWEQVH